MTGVGQWSTGDAAETTSYHRATRVLWVLIGVALAVSIVHYTDNYSNYDDYPAPSPGSSIPVPSATAVLVSWFAFTALGAAALWLWSRRRIMAASVALVGYSFSGLVGIVHYVMPGAMTMVWWRHTHVIADVLCGVAVLAFAAWSATRIERWNRGQQT